MHSGEVQQVNSAKPPVPQLHRFGDYISLQTQMIEVLAGSSSDEDVCHIASRFIPQFIQVQRCTFYRIENNKLVTHYSTEHTDISSEGLKAFHSFQPIFRPLIESVIKQRKSIIDNDFQHVAYADSRKLLSECITSVMITPVLIHHEIVAAITLERTTGIPFQKCDLEFIQQIAAILALRLERNSLLQAKEAHARKIEHANSELNVTIHNLNERETELRHTIETNKELMSITSHDLKNPLGGILGLCELIIEDLPELSGDTHKEVTANAKLIRQEAEHMISIIKNLLDRHRNEAKHEFELQETNVARLIDEVIQWNHSQAMAKHMRMHFIHEGETQFRVDAPSLQRAVDNYVSNAVKYSPQHTDIWIHLDSHALDGSYWKISVRDEGPGLSDEDKKCVFRKMQRLSAKPTAGEHSTGLGLYIVKQIVEHHGGSVGVDSVYGKGATFWMLFPQHDKFLDKFHHESAIRA